MINVIVIDDEVVAVKAIVKRIDWQKYSIHDIYTANSMEQAQQLFAEKKIHLMLCDIEMPNGTGLELFEWVKLHYPNVECIFQTCHMDYKYIRQALKLGSLDYILKPIDYDEIDAILKQAVDRIIHSLNKVSMNKTEKNDTNKSDLGDVNNGVQNEAVMKTMQYIDLHLSEYICIDDIAGEIAINGQYLMRLFKKETGMSILEYITKTRIKIAKTLLLNSNLSISEVSDKVGYDNYSYFIRLFKKATGETPANYRTKH